MVQVAKRKKGRPSKADLARRAAEAQASATESDSRRSLRRKNVRYNIIDYDGDYIDDEEDERRREKKKLKLMTKLHQGEQDQELEDHAPMEEEEECNEIEGEVENEEEEEKEKHEEDTVVIVLNSLFVSVTERLYFCFLSLEIQERENTTNFSTVKITFYKILISSLSIYRYIDIDRLFINHLFMQ